MPKFYSQSHDSYLKLFIENIIMNLRVDGEIESSYLETD
jgi:hypothetical protein